MNNHRARKRFGQNFLHDSRVIEQIIACIRPTNDNFLLEIGPGQAALTQPIVDSLQQQGKLHLLEIDRDLAAALSTRFADHSNVQLHLADALAFDFYALASQEKKALRIFGNLPYNISTPLIFHLLQQNSSATFEYGERAIHDMHFMLQKEVVDRLCATPGSKIYGRLSVMTQYYCHCETLLTVPPGAFSPPPKVQSAVIRLTPFNQKPSIALDERNFAAIVKAGFAQRRKTLRNTLTDHASAAVLESINIDPRARAETLSVNDFVAISNAVSQSKNH
jgi:16S rRNA (adenine1518-N6/adenine1519-N6)-dimethyltransferase